ncbi:hypothetical protein CSIM01_06140 [Colletotrichum simmondsii]|uniref:Uncharacterized protein n=1 Tax=Colletotrichum simmondsii TaxID=703756 RepID=A0A135SNC2_9PEZI|nr:hypothetical protein CSIM01_06140 [Colletotrichum simmondsii]
MSDQQNSAPLKEPSNIESTPKAPNNQNPSDARLARSRGPYIPPDTSYYTVEHDDPVLLEDIKMLKELTSECHKDPTDLLEVVMRVPPRLSKSIVHLAVGLLLHQKLLENILTWTELCDLAETIRNTKNGQDVKKGKKKRSKTTKLADIKEGNENAEDGGSMAPKGLGKVDEKNQKKDNISKAFGPAESNTKANANHLAVSRSKKKKAKKTKKAVKATEIAENNPQLITDQPTAPLNTKTTAKDKGDRGSETIESNAGAITKQSTVSKSKKVKAKEKINAHFNTVKNHAGVNIEQQAMPKNKNEMATTDKKDCAADTQAQAQKAQPESYTGLSKTQNNNKIERCPESNKGKKKAEASKTADGWFFSGPDIECIKELHGRVIRGIKDCQEVWTEVQKMEEAAESNQAKARKMQIQEQTKCSAKGGQRNLDEENDKVWVNSLRGDEVDSRLENPLAAFAMIEYVLGDAAHFSYFRTTKQRAIFHLSLTLGHFGITNSHPKSQSRQIEAMSDSASNSSSDSASDSAWGSASGSEGPQLPFRSSRSAARRRRRARQMQDRRLYEADLPDHDDDDFDDDSGSESSAQWATTLYATPEQLRNLPPLPLKHSNYAANNAATSHPVNPVPGSPVLTESDSEHSENGLNNAVFDDSDIDEAASDISEDSLADVIPDPNVLEAIAPPDSEQNPIVVKSARIITRMRARIAENPGTAIQERRNAIETIGEIFPLRLLTYGGGLSTPFQPLGVWHEGLLLSNIRASLALQLVSSHLLERSTRLRALLDQTRQLRHEVSDEEYITAEEFLTDEED